jgi:hypothetical protein
VGLGGLQGGRSVRGGGPPNDNGNCRNLRTWSIYIIHVLHATPTNRMHAVASRSSYFQDISALHCVQLT